MIYIGKCKIHAIQEFEKYEDIEIGDSMKIEDYIKFIGTVNDISAIHYKKGKFNKREANI